MQPGVVVEVGDWCVLNHKRQDDMCYEVADLGAGILVELNAFHIPSKTRFRCKIGLGFLWVIRKKDGTRLAGPEYG